MHLLGPLFALFVVATERAGLRRWAFYGGLTLIAFLVALLVYAYLPLRSRADPAVDWGNPETLSNWWAVVRRSQYNFMLTQYPRGWARFARQMQAMGGLWSREFTPVLGMVGAAGLLVLLRRHFWYTLWLVAAGLYLVVAFTVAQNFNLDKEWLWVMSVFGIPAYLIMAMGIGGVLGLVQRWLGRWAAGAAALICIAVPLVNHWEHNDKSDYYWAEDYGRNTLESLPPNALYFPGPDHASFSALYLQVVEGLRPDVTLGRKYGYLDLPEAPELRDKFGEFPRRRDEPEILGWYLTHTERPAYFSDYVRLAGAPGVRLVSAGLLCRAVRPGETRETRDDWAEYRWHTLAPGDTRGDYTAELILYEIDYARAREAMARGQYAAGLAALDRGLSRYGREYTVLNNAGVLCARFGQRAAARMYFEEALRLPGQDGATRENLQGLQELLSQP
ncbi:MAG: hypothetical protein HYV26_24075, partial [Candidatus Hydrogenedentes bacterium]|nr:hypothetical protein [Candidatus Hydrogenedentota bacterium]